MTELNGVLGSLDDKHLMYTDGGPDHWLTSNGLNLFLSRDLDFLCAVTTPPYRSWKESSRKNYVHSWIAMCRSDAKRNNCLRNFEEL